jgi:hypothetical protein
MEEVLIKSPTMKISKQMAHCRFSSSEEEEAKIAVISTMGSDDRTSIAIVDPDPDGIVLQVSFPIHSKANTYPEKMIMEEKGCKHTLHGRKNANADRNEPLFLIFSANTLLVP